LSTHIVDFHIKVWRERYVDYLHVVDFGTHFVHAVRGWRLQDFVLTRTAKDAHEQVNRFVGSDADKDVLSLQPIPAVGHQLILEMNLVGIRITLERVLVFGSGRSVSVFVGVEQDSVGIVIACAPIRLQFQDVLSSQPSGNADLFRFSFRHV
jgi:hypothetical protein